MLNIGKRLCCKRSDDSETDRRGAQRPEERNQNAGVPAVDGYCRSHEDEAGNAKQLPGYKRDNERDDSPQACVCQHAAHALECETRAHAGGPGSRPDGKHDERRDKQSLHDRTQPVAGLTPIAHTTAGLSRIVCRCTSENPARVSAAAISSPFAAAVASVAPGPRGWCVIAMRPPGRITRRSASRRSIDQSANMIALTASTLSNRSANVGSRSTEPSRTSTRPVRMAAALRFVACRTISSE